MFQLQDPFGCVPWPPKVPARRILKSFPLFKSYCRFTPPPKSAKSIASTENGPHELVCDVSQVISIKMSDDSSHETTRFEEFLHGEGNAFSKESKHNETEDSFWCKEAYEASPKR